MYRTSGLISSPIVNNADTQNLFTVRRPVLRHILTEPAGLISLHEEIDQLSVANESTSKQTSSENVTERLEIVIPSRSSSPSRTSPISPSNKDHPLIPIKGHHPFSNLDHDEFNDSPTCSTKSLPARPVSTGGYGQYERALHMLANDTQHQKEVALGKRIAFYRLGKELGAGNFSKVKYGVHILTKEKVAVKIMDKTKMDQKSLKLLKREIDCLEQLHHPNIIRLFECVETLARMHLIMEYAGGGELYDHVRQKGRLMEDEAKTIFVQLAAAVFHMHSKYIIHRDIKCENVIFAGPDFVKLADFGFSCATKPRAMLDTFCGSPPYAAPELFRDKEYSGPKVDIWALGVLLYFLLVGRLPFSGQTVNELRAAILKGEFAMPGEITIFAQDLIKKMLELNLQIRVTIDEIVKCLWLRGSRRPKPYQQCSIAPDAQELESSPLARRVWDQLHEFGITVEMMKEASSKGAKNAIIGTYRIVLFQEQQDAVANEINRFHAHNNVQKMVNNNNADIDMKAHHNKFQRKESTIFTQKPRQSNVCVIS